MNQTTMSHPTPTVDQTAPGYPGPVGAEVPPDETAAPVAPPHPGPAFGACQECGAPMDRLQRYCVNCGGRWAEADNPSSRFFAASARWRRRSARPTKEPAVNKGSRALAVGFFALLPIAVALGVMVGRSGDSGSGVNEDLLAALNAPGAVAAQTATSDQTETTTTTEEVSSEVLKSDFALKEGYTVMIGLLPVASTNNETATKAKSDAQSKGAKDVGVINPSDFQLTPSKGTENYVLYSGEFKSKGEAEKALAGLKKDFPEAEVLKVKKPTVDSVGRVIARTEAGVVRDITTYNPTEEQVKKDTQIVEELATDTGKDYLEKAEELPDIIAIGGDGGSTPAPVGAGD